MAITPLKKKPAATAAQEKRINKFIDAAPDAASQADADRMPRRTLLHPYLVELIDARVVEYFLPSRSGFLNLAVEKALKMSKSALISYESKTLRKVRFERIKKAQVNFYMPVNLIELIDARVAKDSLPSRAEFINLAVIRALDMTKKELIA